MSEGKNVNDKEDQASIIDFVCTTGFGCSFLDFLAEDCCGGGDFFEGCPPAFAFFPSLMFFSPKKGPSLRVIHCYTDGAKRKKNFDTELRYSVYVPINKLIRGLCFF